MNGSTQIIVWLACSPSLLHANAQMFLLNGLIKKLPGQHGRPQGSDTAVSMPLSHHALPFVTLPASVNLQQTAGGTRRGGVPQEDDCPSQNQHQQTILQNERWPILITVVPPNARLCRQLMNLLIASQRHCIDQVHRGGGLRHEITALTLARLVLVT